MKLKSKLEMLINDKELLKSKEIKNEKTAVEIIKSEIEKNVRN